MPLRNIAPAGSQKRKGDCYETLKIVYEYNNDTQDLKQQIHDVPEEYIRTIRPVVIRFHERGSFDILGYLETF